MQKPIFEPAADIRVENHPIPRWELTDDWAFPGEPTQLDIEPFVEALAEESTVELVRDEDVFEADVEPFDAPLLAEDDLEVASLTALLDDITWPGPPR